MNHSLIIVLVGLPVFLVLLWVGLRHKPHAGPAAEAWDAIFEKPEDAAKRMAD
jgi:hypothetical protein